MLSGRTSHTRVESIIFFVPELDLSGGYGDLACVMLCNTLVLWAWSVINPGVSKYTKLALGMTLLELHYILQVFCVHQEDGGGVNRGSQRHSKSKEFWRRSQGNWRPRFGRAARGRASAPQPPRATGVGPLFH